MARAICKALLLIVTSAVLSACASLNETLPHPGQSPPPYPPSRLIAGVKWNFTTIPSLRKAQGSDLWPCTWAADNNLYCAWGDGGGFDGNSDRIGRVSLGFARVTGVPTIGDPAAFGGKNIWGQLPYAEVQANFGGKVDSLIAINGLLYGVGGLWTNADSADPVHRSERGPHSALIRSADFGRSWMIIARSQELTQGSFLNFGRDDAYAIDAYVYSYYVRVGDNSHIYLTRIPKERLTSGNIGVADVRYFAGAGRGQHGTPWSSNESQAEAIFYDARHVLTPSVTYDVPLKRFLLTVGHLASDQGDAAGAGQMGLFESAHPWGPWATIGYYDHWDDLDAVPSGDFLGLQIPSKWISADGKVLWAVFSGPGIYDSFNVVQVVLTTRHHWWQGIR